MPQRKILIFGGSFDPPHKEHTKLLKYAVKHINSDIAYIFPSYHSPLKSLSTTPAKFRLEMTKAAFGHISKKIKVDPFEINRSKKTYTYEILKYLNKTHSKDKFYLLVGSDCLNHFTDWKNYKYILQNCTLIEALRKGTEVTKKPNFKFKTLPKKFEKVSSTLIRQNILLTGKAPKTISEKTAKLIKKYKLYGLNIHHWLKENLTAKRYYHTICSAKLAAELADTYNIDKTAIIKAALLHDCAKAFSNNYLTRYIRQNNINFYELDEIIKYQPSVLHSYVSADIAEKKFAVKDKKILKAIAAHTLGDLHMTVFDKIIYVADIASTDRKIKHSFFIRHIAFKDLDKAFFESVRAKLKFIISKDKWLCLHSVRLWNILTQK